MAITVRREYLDDVAPQLLIPVPLAYWSAVRRGYNQSHELARGISKQLNIRVAANAVSRIAGPSQRDLNRSERLRLKSKTFRLRQKIKCSHVAVIDDVMTTGATVRVLCQALRAAGVDRIDIWCATRAVLG